MYTHKFHKIINLTIYNAFWYFLLSYSLSLKQNKMVVIDEDSSPVLSLQTVVIDKYDPIFYFQTDLPWCAFSCVKWQCLNKTTPGYQNDTGLC